MKKKKNKIVLVIISILFISLVGLSIYYLFNSKSKNSLSLEENKWIDSNKYNVIDIGLMNDIPVLSYEGKGILYDYLEFITENQGLQFNIVSYKLDSVIDYDYKTEIVSELSNNQIPLFKDNLILVTNNDISYVNLEDIKNIKIGILSSDRDMISNYLNTDTVELVDYGTYSELKQALLEASVNLSENVGTVNINGIIIPKLIFTKEIIQNNYKISFHFNNLTKYYVLSTSGPSQLNSIMRKDYNLWNENNYLQSYNSNLLINYFSFKDISDTDQKKLQSKKYVYGFIDYGIYNYLNNNKIYGFNELLLKGFNQFSNLSIKYIKYNSISKMLKDFDSNKVDFIMNISDRDNYTNDVYTTLGAFDKRLMFVSGLLNVDIIDSLASLKEKEVLTIKNSYLEKYLKDNNIKVKSYKNMEDLTADFTNYDIALLDVENYNYYKTTAFKDSKINYILPVNEKYNYIINNNESNAVFEEVFDFYLNYNSINQLVTSSYEDVAYENINISYILIVIIIILSIYIIVDFYNHVKIMIKNMRKRKKIHLSKEDKIKYIDQLTSLKNRAYLNSKIETWDDSEVYPQAIIVIDLNNISYINDNYGREEGDKVIAEAANILIQHQLHNSEIIRTDGNEFLIYLVGYSEKQVIAYLRRLNKELKSLSHGFGAASGYSIINDAIKTFDDAVNEATLDMKNNKEDIAY